MANALFQRRDAFLNNNASTPLSPPSRSTTGQLSPAAGVKAHFNGHHHAASPKDMNPPMSPIGAANTNNGFPSAPSSTVKKYASVNVKELHGTVGFANIPNQVFRKATKEGFEFTLMVVGQSGLGKSTFLNSLFSTDLYNSDAMASSRTTDTEKTLQIKETTVQLVENNVSLKLTLVDTPGFGDAVDNSDCWDPIIQFVDKKFFDYFSEESKLKRMERIPDNRVHCCLYFIPATGHGLKPLDIEFMKHLHDRVNIIPVISKADTMMPSECANFKKKVAREIADHGIQIYEFPDMDTAEQAKEYKQYKDRVPFAVVGSNIVRDLAGGKKARCRSYPWGTVEVENLEHNDFIALRDTIIRTFLIDLIDITRFVHYENYRYRELVMCKSDNDSKSIPSETKDPFTQMEELRRESELRMKQESAKMDQRFQKELADRLEQLTQQEYEVDRYVQHMRCELDEKRREFDRKQVTFLQERKEFAQQYPEYQKQLSSSSLNGDKEKVKKKRSMFSRDGGHNVSSTSSRQD